MTTLLDYKEVATRLHKHPQTVLRWLRTGYLKGKKIGKSWMVDEADLEAFINNPPPYPSAHYPSEKGL